MNPGDNLVNLPEDYIQELEALPKRERQRFLFGKFMTEVEGALWTDEIIQQTKKATFPRRGDCDAWVAFAFDLGLKPNVGDL